MWLFTSVIIPITFLMRLKTFEKNAVLILAWGGLRGGLTVVLALSLPKNIFIEVFVAIT
jgi:CPA1 family monovalent cation:H+ antiporter